MARGGGGEMYEGGAPVAGVGEGRMLATGSFGMFIFFLDLWIAA